MFTKRVTMQSAAAATGNGTAVTVHDVTTLGMQVAGTFVGTVTFETTIGDSDWGSLQVETVASGAVVTAATAPGIFRATVAGLSQVRARVSAWTSGTITVTAFATEAGGGMSLADIDIQAAPALAAGEAHVGEVGGKGAVVSAAFARPNDVTAYASKDAVSDSTSSPTVLTFTNLARVNAGTGYIVKARIMTDQSTNVARYRLHLYNVAPTAINDNAAWTLLWANRAARIGYVDFDGCQTEGTGSDCANAVNTTVRLHFAAAAGVRTLYGLLETLDAFTPAANQNFYVELSAELD